MSRLFEWNTLQEVADYLTEETGENWIPSRVLLAGARESFTLFFVAPPDVSALEVISMNGILDPYKLHARDAEQLLQVGHILVHFANGLREPVFGIEMVRAFNPPAEITFDEIRISCNELEAFAASKRGTPQRTEPPTAAKGEAENIPGKMPRIAIGKLAIKAAFQIECETRKLATARLVIERLQSWVDHKDNPNAVTELIEKIPNGVMWVTSAGIKKPYDVETCQKTLENWNKTRT